MLLNVAQSGGLIIYGATSEQITEGGYVGCVVMDVPSKNDELSELSRYVFRGELLSDPIAAEESAAAGALQFLCSFYGFEMNDSNYRKAHNQMMKVRLAERRIYMMRNQQATTVQALRSACNQASNVLPIQVRNSNGIYPRPEDTIYAGSTPPRTSAEKLASALSNIITDAVQPNNFEEQ